MATQYPTLNELSDPHNFEKIFRQVILEMFGKDGSHKSYLEAPHGVTDSSWTTGGHFSQLSRELGDLIYQKVPAMVENKVKKFNPNMTKLTPELISLEDVWQEISNWVGSKIEELAGVEKNEIPGLDHGVKEGVIMTAPGKTVPQTTLEEREKIRAGYLEKLPKINDEFVLLSKFRNSLYDHFRQRYGIFNQREGEIGKIAKK